MEYEENSISANEEEQSDVDPLSDLFGFEAAEKRVEQERALIAAKEIPPFKPWRVFINHVDSYHGKLLADILSNTVYVDPLRARADEEEFEDENDEEEKEERKWPDEDAAEVSRKYEVIGTVLDHESPRPENVTVIMRDDTDDGNRFVSIIMSCGVIIYDITQHANQIEEACWVLKEIVSALEEKQEKSPKAFERDEPARHFILISTVMTWARTKPLDPEDPDLPFTEADYRKRKPHPNYKDHIRCEREVVIVKKIASLRNKLKTLVVCCGITYGEEEGPLHYLFKMAWHNAPFLPIFDKGRNQIPLLHVRDLAAIVSSVLQNWPPMRYIVAVEQELISQAALVKRISRGLTTGKVKRISPEEALRLPEVSQQVYDQMTLNLRIDPIHIVDRIRWHHDMPFRHITDVIIREYKAARGLHPVKIVVLGPPASGKTRVARYLANHYEIHYVHVQSLISDTIQRLINDIEAAELAEERGEEEEDVENLREEEEEPDEEEVPSVESLREQLNEIRVNMAENNGRLDDTILNKLFLNRLKSKECTNQGYVMDGHPKTLEQANKLFLLDKIDLEEEEEEYEDEDAVVDDANILPELVVVLEASDEFLEERVMNLSEQEIQNTHYTEEHMLRRLREYRERNTDENTPLQLFDELEIHPFIVSVETDFCVDMFPTVSQCLEKIGKPRNYGPTPEEIEEARKRAKEAKEQAEAAKKLREEQEVLERKRLREKRLVEWTNLIEQLKQEEEERLYILAQPLQRYLVNYVLPTLTEALVEVAIIRPEDPVDFLAEFLFRKNPQGRMFEPDYTETLKLLMDAMERQEVAELAPKRDSLLDIVQFLHERDEKVEVQKLIAEREKMAKEPIPEPKYEENELNKDDMNEMEFEQEFNDEFDAMDQSVKSF